MIMTKAPASSAPHIPVLRDEILAQLAVAEGKTYVDATFGAGGYSRAMLEAAPCRVIGLDRDPDVQPFADQLQQEFGERFAFIGGCFSDMVSLLAQQGITQIDGLVMDLGVSSMQIDQAERGFSFQREGPLDMRQSQSGQNAAEVIAQTEEADLADILYHYGEERLSRRIARAIVQARQEGPITTTRQLAEIIAQAAPQPGQKIHPATRSFQALRIYVNRELEELETGLNASKALLGEGGRLVVVSFHSLEDRLTKQFLIDCSRKNWGESRHQPLVGPELSPLFTLPHRKPITATDAEIARNPRARSARLRTAIRTAEEMPQ